MMALKIIWDFVPQCGHVNEDLPKEGVSYDIGFDSVADNKKPESRKSR